MRCSSIWCPCNIFLLAVLLCVLGGSMLAGVSHLAGAIADSAAAPNPLWMPVSAVAAAGTVWGLWQGRLSHGRGEPLAVGVFGVVWLEVGFVTTPMIALMGTGIVFGAAVWSAFAFQRRPASGSQ